MANGALILHFCKIRDILKSTTISLPQIFKQKKNHKL